MLVTFRGELANYMVRLDPDRFYNFIERRIPPRQQSKPYIDHLRIDDKT
jgi:hypothetical protein